MFAGRRRRHQHLASRQRRGRLGRDVQEIRYPIRSLSSGRLPITRWEEQARSRRAGARAIATSLSTMLLATERSRALLVGIELLAGEHDDSDSRQVGFPCSSSRADRSRSMSGRRLFDGTPQSNAAVAAGWPAPRGAGGDGDDLDVRRGRATRDGCGALPRASSYDHQQPLVLRGAR